MAVIPGSSPCARAHCTAGDWRNFLGPQLKHITCAIFVNQSAQVFFFDRDHSDHKSMVYSWHSVNRNGGTVRVESLSMGHRSQGVYFPSNHRRRSTLLGFYPKNTWFKVLLKIKVGPLSRILAKPALGGSQKDETESSGV